MQDAGGYAKEATQEFLQKQKETIFKHVTEADIVITTALVPGKKAPILVSEEMVKHMRCLLYTSPSPRDRTRSRMPSSA